MDLTPTTRIHAILEEWPFLQDFLIAYNPRFRLLENRAMRATMGRIATLRMVSSMGGVPLERLLEDLAAAVEREAGTRPAVRTDDGDAGSAEELATLRAMIRRLHAGEPLERLQAEYEPILSRMDPMRIAEMEQSLIDEGTPAEEIQALCDVHVALFRRSLEGTEPPKVPPGHPIHTALAENRWIEARLDAWDTVIQGVGSPDWAAVAAIAGDLARVDLHYQRKEQALFPFLERKQFTGPSTVMWGVHDDVRARLREVREAVATRDAARVRRAGTEASRAVLQMIFMEERILYPTALGLLDPGEWAEVGRAEGEVGYLVPPAAEWPLVSRVVGPGERLGEGPPFLPPREAAHVPGGGEAIPLGAGALTAEQLDRILRLLPLDLSFVDAEDRVAWYSDVPDRVFARTPAVIGRPVQRCHPPKSLHVVEEILRAFKEGRQDRARFWLQIGERFVIVEYVAVRAADGLYLGCLEVTQDATGIRALEGERRLLSWSDGER